MPLYEEYRPDAHGEPVREVVVRTARDSGSAARLTCKAQRDNPVPRHELLRVERRS